MGRLDGKVALISGGARGQGAVETELFAREGAMVVFGDLLDQEGAEVEARVRADGGDATYVHMDVTQEADWRRAVELAESKYGGLDILVNNAGMIRRGYLVENTTEEVWWETLDVNAKGMFLGTRECTPALKRAGGGSIINISSLAGIIGRDGSPTPYSMSKGAVRGLTKVAAVDLAKENIRCNAIFPGPIETGMMTRGALADSAFREAWTRAVPLGRMGSPEDVAYAVLYLASDEAAWVTGAELVIDGGVTAA